MAVENIVVEIKASADQLQSTLDALTKLGNISAKDAEDFKKLSTETKKFTDEATKATEAVKQSAAASTTKQAALEKEIARLKELEILSKKAADPVSAQKFTAAIKESEAAIKKLNGELLKSQAPVKSLRQAYAEAKNEVTRLADESGGRLTPELLKSAKAAAVIKDRISDLNKTLDALNPEAKLTAFVQVGVGISGAFTAAQGAMALFGTESEDVQRALLKVQGALALTQGLNSVLQLGDAFRNLRVVLGLTTTAQVAVTAATTGTAVAQTGLAVATNLAAVAFNRLKIAFATNPIGFIVTALAAVTAALLIFNSAQDEATDSTEDATDALEEYNSQLEQTRKLEEGRQQVISQLRNEEINNIRREIALLEARNEKGKLDREIILKKSELISKQIDLLFALREASELGQFTEQQAQQVFDLNTELEVLKVNLQNLKREKVDEVITIKAIDGIQTLIDKLKDAQKAINNLPDTLKAPSFKVPDIDFKKQEEELREFVDLSFQLADSLTNFISTVIGGANDASIQALEEQRDARLNAFDEELESLKELNNNKIISDGAYTQKSKELAKQRELAEKESNKKIGEEKRKAFIAQRAASVAQAIINGAEAMTKVSAQTGVLTFVFSPLIAALVALQIATILATPIPKFRKGVLALQGAGTETSDSIPAMLSRNESVMTAGETKKFMPTLTAIRKNLISPELLNSFVINGQFGKVEAFVDTHKLSKNSRKQIPYQADMIGRSVAKHLSDYQYYSPLRQ